MNENLKNTEDGTKATYKTVNGLAGQVVELAKEGRIYFPFAIVGKTGHYHIEHLPTGMSLSNNGWYEWPTLKKIKVVIEAMREVHGCESADILGTSAVASFAGIIRDHLEK